MDSGCWAGQKEHEDKKLEEIGTEKGKMAEDYEGGQGIICFYVYFMSYATLFSFKLLIFQNILF